MKIKRKLFQIEDQRQLIADEIRGVVRGMYSGTSGISGNITGVVGLGPAAKRNEQNLQALEIELSVLKRENGAKLNTIDSSITQLQVERDTIISRLIPKLSQDYLAREVAFSTLTENNPIVERTMWLLMLFFIFVDIIPVTFKVLTPYGAYDALLNAYSNVNTDNLKYHHLSAQTLRKYVEMELLKKYGQKVDDIISGSLISKPLVELRQELEALLVGKILSGIKSEAGTIQYEWHKLIFDNAKPHIESLFKKYGQGLVLIGSLLAFSVVYNNDHKIPEWVLPIIKKDYAFFLVVCPTLFLLVYHCTAYFIPKKS